MGKIRKPKQKNHKPPVTQPEDDSEGQEFNDTEIDTKENAIQTVLDQLQTANVEEKYCGLQTFALLIENHNNIEQLLSSGVVKASAPLMLDAASSVRNAAAGVLRNLSTCGLETCDALMEQDVMTPLVCYFHEHAQSWVPDAKAIAKKDEDAETFIHCTNLLWNLCESSDLAIKYLGQSRILDIFPRYLDLATFGSDIVTAVLQCLFVVIEDNPKAMEKVKVNYEKQLEQLLALTGNDPAVLLMRTLSAGVILNTCGGNIATLPVEVINKIVTILATTLAVDHRFVCNQLSNCVPLVDNTGKITAPKGKEAEVLESQLKSVSLMIEAQQTSVEILANICSNEDNEDVMDADDSSDGDDIDEEICNDIDDSILAEDRLPPQVLEALVSLEIFDKVWARTQLPAANVLLVLKEYEGSKSIHKKLFNLQARSLLCVNNMISALPIENLGDVNGVYKIWVEAGKLAFKQSAENLTLLESATAVMRASLDKIKLRGRDTSSQNLFTDLAVTDIEMMLTGIRECQVPEIRSNLIRMIGILALLLINDLNDTTNNVICVITEFLIEQAHKENEVWVLAEAVDTIVDLYSEDETDALAAKVKLADKLAIIAPILKSKARQQKRLPKEYKVLVSTAVSNLPRFIKYIRDRVSKL